MHYLLSSSSKQGMQSICSLNLRVLVSMTGSPQDSQVKLVNILAFLGNGYFGVLTSNTSPRSDSIILLEMDCLVCFHNFSSSGVSP